MSKVRNMQGFAQVSGVSRPTLSKYFNDPASVRPATRARIESALQDHDFRPNLFAVNQNRRLTRTIGILVPDILDPFYAELLRRIDLLCQQAGFWAVILTAHGQSKGEDAALDRLRALKPAGAVIAPLGAASRRDHLGAFAQDVPTVFLDSPAGGGEAFVGTDNSHSIGLMVDHLCQSGEPPCFLDMPDVNANAAQRRTAYQQAMARHGHASLVLPVPLTDWAFERLGHDEGLRLLARGALPSSTVLCANDRLAFGFLAAAHERGLRVGVGPGHALRVAGHDDHPLSRFTCPALTTVAQDHAGLAERSVEALFAMIAAGPGAAPPPPLRLPGRLILRQSA